ncbi:MAG: hypothetical protein VX900_08780 [Pseudomonadota bacterium]|nr:hypothetical protein [Pseudomonadota bacterium]
MLGRPIGVASPEEAEGTATRLRVGVCVLGGGTTAGVAATGRGAGVARSGAAVGGGGGAKVGRADAAVLAARSAEAGLLATSGGGVIRGVFGAGGAMTGRDAVAAEGLLTRGGGATGGGGDGIRTDEGVLNALRWVVGVGARTVCGGLTVGEATGDGGRTGGAATGRLTRGVGARTAGRATGTG